MRSVGVVARTTQRNDAPWPRLRNLLAVINLVPDLKLGDLLPDGVGKLLRRERDGAEVVPGLTHTAGWLAAATTGGAHCARPVTYTRRDRRSSGANMKLYVPCKQSSIIIMGSSCLALGVIQGQRVSRVCIRGPRQVRHFRLLTRGSTHRCQTAVPRSRYQRHSQWCHRRGACGKR